MKEENTNNNTGGKDCLSITGDQLDCVVSGGIVDLSDPTVVSDINALEECRKDARRETVSRFSHAEFSLSIVCESLFTVDCVSQLDVAEGRAVRVGVSSVDQVHRGSIGGDAL